jgi:hypothetical protein
VIAQAIARPPFGRACVLILGLSVVLKLSGVLVLIP